MAVDIRTPAPVGEPLVEEVARAIAGVAKHGSFDDDKHAARAALAVVARHQGGERERCAQIVRRYQDLVGWQPGDSRNTLLQEIEDEIRGTAPHGEETP